MSPNPEKWISEAENNKSSQFFQKCLFDEIFNFKKTQKNMELEDIDFFNLIGLPTPSTNSSYNQSIENKDFSNFESDSTNLDR